jgi:hypothetical protein
MRFTSLTVAALLLAESNVTAFSVRPPMLVAPGRTIAQPRLSPLHFTEVSSGGMEELQDFTEQDKSPLSQQFRKSPSFWKMAGMASIPVSAVLGFGLVPSRRLAAHAAGALVTGVAGAVGKSKLDAVAESVAKPSIAQAILDHGLDDAATTAAYVKAVQETFGIVDDDDFEAMCSEIYSKYLMGMVKFNPVAKTSELKELENLKVALGLSNLQVGDAHAAAASEWYRTTCLFTPEEDLQDPDHPDRKAMDKVLFLTERALRQGGETDEAFNFEMTRVAKALNLKTVEAVERVAEVVEPFYQRALKSTRNKLGSNQVSAAMLERARKTLGVSQETAVDMHIACFNEEVKALLGLETEGDEEVDTSAAVFEEGAKEKVSIDFDFIHTLCH